MYTCHVMLSIISRFLLPLLYRTLLLCHYSLGRTGIPHLDTGVMVISAANLCHTWLVYKCSLCNRAPTISGAFITRNIPSVVFQPVAVSTCCNYKSILASGVIVEDEQLQCQLQPLCYATIYLSKWCNCGR